MAIPKGRFDSLAPEVRSEFLESATRRLQHLKDTDFVHEAHVLFATAAAR
jgi:hypothetical protein